MLKGIINGWVSYEKEKKRKTKSLDWEYADLYKQEVLYSSDYLSGLAKDANTKAKRNAIHEYMNKFRDGDDDIYDIDNYRKVSEFLISKERFK